MALTYEARQTGNVTILDISGRIDLGVTIAFGEASNVSLSALVHDFAERGHKNMVLNFRDVSYMDSSGIGELVGSVTSVRKLGGDLKVVNPNMIVKKLLGTCRLDSVIDVKPDEASAVEAFSRMSAKKA
ncbi:MAG: STAS domain-containing protein [Terriglobales bacterium]